MTFVNQIGYWGWGLNGLICRFYSLVSPVLIQIIINFQKLFPRELGLIVRNITSNGCAAKDGRLQVSNFTTSCFSMPFFFNPSLFLYFPPPFPLSPVHRFLLLLLFHPVFCLFPRCRAWSQAIATALRILVNIKIRNIYLVGERC